MEDDQWYDVRIELATFARILIAADYLVTADDVAHFIEKPWKWEIEREIWEKCGRPDQDSPHWPALAALYERREDTGSNSPLAAL